MRTKNYISEIVQEQIRKAGERAAAKKAEEEAAKQADNSDKKDSDEQNEELTESPQKGGKKKLAVSDD